jgi:hypothetical protein
LTRQLLLLLLLLQVTYYKDVDRSLMVFVWSHSICDMSGAIAFLSSWFQAIAAQQQLCGTTAAAAAAAQLSTQADTVGTRAAAAAAAAAVQVDACCQYDPLLFDRVQYYSKPCAVSGAVWDFAMDPEDTAAAAAAVDEQGTAAQAAAGHVAVAAATAAVAAPLTGADMVVCVAATPSTELKLAAPCPFLDVDQGAAPDAAKTAATADFAKARAGACMNASPSSLSLIGASTDADAAMLFSWGSSGSSSSSKSSSSSSSRDVNLEPCSIKLRFSSSSPSDLGCHSSDNLNSSGGGGSVGRISIEAAMNAASISTSCSDVTPERRLACKEWLKNNECPFAVSIQAS